MSRKDTLKAMLSRRDSELPHGNSEVDEQEAEMAPEKKLQHIRSGVRRWRDGPIARQYRECRRSGACSDRRRSSGRRYFSQTKIDSSFVADRLPDDGEGFKELLEAIRTVWSEEPGLVAAAS
jgi:ParB family chromosome partitioning protein